jgi:hypothetical protein
MSHTQAFSMYIWLLDYMGLFISNNNTLNLFSGFTLLCTTVTHTLCRDFYNSVNPKGPSKRGRESDSDNRMSEAYRNAHHKKIKTWFLNPSRYKSELEAEQKKHHGKCIYHLSRSHTMENCHVKKECDATVAGRGSSNNSSSNSASTTG